MPSEYGLEAKESAISQFEHDISRPFAREEFATLRHPVPLGMIQEASGLYRPLPSCLDMPVKLAGCDTLALPEPYRSNPAICEMIDKAFAFERAHNPAWQEYYAYLTVDTRKVERGKSQRNGGWHFDGMQGVRYPKKLPACHSYLCSTAVPTEFSHTPASRLSYLDESRHNWFQELGHQLDPQDSIRAQPNALYAMSAYQQHRSVEAEEDTQRTFIRVEFSLKRFNRVGNTVNPNLDSGFEYEARPSPMESMARDSSWTGAARFSESGKTDRRSR